MVLHSGNKKPEKVGQWERRRSLSPRPMPVQVLA